MMSEAIRITPALTSLSVFFSVLNFTFCRSASVGVSNPPSIYLNPSIRLYLIYGYKRLEPSSSFLPSNRSLYQNDSAMWKITFRSFISSSVLLSETISVLSFIVNVVCDCFNSFSNALALFDSSVPSPMKYALNTLGCGATKP